MSVRLNYFYIFVQSEMLSNGAHSITTETDMDQKVCLTANSKTPAQVKRETTHLIQDIGSVKLRPTNSVK